MTGVLEMEPDLGHGLQAQPPELDAEAVPSHLTQSRWEARCAVLSLLATFLLHSPKVKQSGWGGGGGVNFEQSVDAGLETPSPSHSHADAL